MPTSSPSVPMPPMVRSLRLGRHPGGGGRGASSTFGSRRRSLASTPPGRAVVTVAVTALVLLLGSTIGTCASAAAAAAASSAAASAPDSSLALPPEFSIRGLSSSSSSTNAPPDGLWELVWDAPSSPTNVRRGGSRPEFRLGSDVLLGYPQHDAHAERTGRLVLALPLTPSVHDQLHRSGGQDLQVWFSGRRLDVSTASAKGTNVRKLTAAPTVSTNPAQVGPYKIRRRSYDLRPGISVTGYPAPLEVLAEVTYPRDLDPTTPSLGPVPLVVFLHGQHATCYRGERTTSTDWPCIPGYRPIPSHKGFRYVADILASQGYVAVSIAANSINAQDFLSLDVGSTARSILIRHHLTLWAAWNAGDKTDPWGGIFRGKLDLTKVVLVGHTHGGEAVHRAAIEATSRAATVPYKIVGLVTYGPTANGRQVNPNVPSVTILGTCDGAVFGLPGQAYVDSSRDVAYSTALRSAVIVVGANSHYFNTEWTPGLAAAPADDDWSYNDFFDSDPVCSSTTGVYRLTSQEQRVVGATYTLALVRLAVHLEQDMLPLLDGTFVRPQAIGRANVVTHAVGGVGYRLLYKAESLGTPQLGRGMKGRECQGYLPRGSNNPLPVCSICTSCSPHFLQPLSIPSRPAPQALLLAWNETGAIARFKIERSQRDFRTFDSVDVRIANDPDRADGSVLEMWLVDGWGRFVKLDTSLKSIEGWPGTDVFDRIHARALRGSLALHPKAKFSLKNVTQVALVAGGDTGTVWVLDVAATQRRVAAVPNLNLPVVSVELLPVLEGDGPNSAMVKITSDRPFPTKGSIWVEKGYTGFLLPIPAGTNGVIREFSFSWVGDGGYYPFPDFGTATTIGALTGAVVANFRGGINVVEDEIKPTVAAVTRRVTVNEGQDLVWNFTTLSAPDDYYSVQLECLVVPPTALLANQTELTSHDVPRTWLTDKLFDPPPTDKVPLSDLPLYYHIEVSPTDPPGSIVIPTAKDGVAEPKDGVVALYCTDGTGYLKLLLTGVVRANSS